MRKLYNYILIILCLLFIPKIALSQITTYYQQQNGSLELIFYKEKIEAEAQSTIFNILKIKNLSQSQFSGRLNISVPLGWTVIGDENYDIQIPENDSVNIPVRISISQKAIGDIGYSIVGTVLDLNGKVVKSAYSFVTIPRYNDFTANPGKKITYLSKDQDKINFEYILTNKGNVNELIHLEASSSGNIEIEGRDEYTPFVSEYSLAPNSDTTISLEISKSKQVKGLSYSSIKINTTSADTSYNRIFWLKILDNIFIYKIPEYNKCAIIELFAHNLLSTSKPYYSILAEGRILFKNGGDFYYYYRNNDIERTLKKEQQSVYLQKGYIGYVDKFIDVRVGSIEKNIEQNIYGAGADLKLKYKRNFLEGLYAHDILNRYYNVGGMVNIDFKSFTINTGSIYTDLYAYSTNSFLYFGGTSFSFFKKNNLSFNAGYSNINLNNNDTSYTGFGFKTRYQLNLKKLRLDITGGYADPYYVGDYKGQLSVNGQADYKISPASSINFKYIKLSSSGYYDLYSNFALSYNRDINNWQLEYAKTLNRFFSYKVGPGVKIESSNQLSITRDIFKTYDANLTMMANIRSKYSKFIIVPRVKFGAVRSFYQDSIELLDNAKIYNTFDLSLNVYKTNIGLISVFRYGPTNITEHYLYYESNFFAKWFFIMPYYSETILDDRLKVDIRGSYIKNISTNDNNYNLSSQLSLFLPKDFTFFFNSSFTNRSKIINTSNIKYSYSSVYFEVGIRKEFNCNQPRIKYHDLQVIFFKDLNGNRTKEKNEPGINNIFVNIIRDIKKEEKVYDNEFMEVELMTDQFGEIQYKNIPSGNYLIKYQLIGEIAGNYSLESLENEAFINEDQTIYIPYLENNKIIGKIVLNRDPLSSLGQIDISNIRVIAEDTEGRTYSALSDMEGNFVLYTPKADHYVVKVNNIFYESFDLQQSEYVVKFNGYKQFEVTFIFDEKKRKINFDDNISTDEVKMDELQVIKKTTLTGKIRDAISLEPIEAKIEIIDNKTNKVVSSAISNRLNGNYSISYVAGDHFRIEVKAEGHWDHVENLYIEQIISIQNIAKDIIMNKLSEGQKKQTFIIYDEKEQEKFTENYKTGQKIPVNNLNFDEKETRLSPNAYPDLDRIVDLLKKNSTVRIEVAGHADDTGQERLDNLLALRRAKAVARYLTEHGISEDRIEVKSYSNTRPLVPGTNDKAKQRNRRVEIMVL